MGIVCENIYDTEFLQRRNCLQGKEMGGGGGERAKKKTSVKQEQQPGSTDFSFAPNTHKTVEARSHATSLVLVAQLWTQWQLLLSCPGIRLECRHSYLLLVLHHVLAEKKQIFWKWIIHHVGRSSCKPWQKRLRAAALPINGSRYR